MTESVIQLLWVMDSLVSFTEEEVLTATVPSNWVEVSSPRLAEPAPWDTQCSHSHSCSCNTQAHPRGSLLAAHSGDQPTATERRDEPATPTQQVMPQQSEHKSSCPLPGFVEIVRSLWGQGSLWIVISVPPEEAEESYEAVGSSIMATQLFQHPTSGEMYVNMLTCTLSAVDLGIDPMAEDHPVLPLWEHSYSD